MSHALFKRNGGGGAGGIFDNFFNFGLDLVGGFERRAIDPFAELDLIPRAVRTFLPPAATPPPDPIPTTPVPSAPSVPFVSPSDSPEAPMGFFDDIGDLFKDIVVGAGRTIARSVTPDPIEAAIQVFFPEVGAQVFGSPMGFPIPDIVPPTFPVIISETGATPPFLPGPAGTIGRTEDLFPGVFGPPGPVGGVTGVPQDINIPEFGVVRDEPGIADDLWRFILDTGPELIPEALGGGVGGAVETIIQGIGVFEGGAPVSPGVDVLDDLTPVLGPAETISRITGAVPMAEMTIEQWAASGRPSGFCLTTRGTVTRRRRRRKRPLSQQAKDDLAWAKATFGAGKQFDAVVSRMRF